MITRIRSSGAPAAGSRSRRGFGARNGPHGIAKDEACPGDRNHFAGKGDRFAPGAARPAARPGSARYGLVLLLAGLGAACESATLGTVGNPYPEELVQGSLTFRVESVTAIDDGEVFLEQRLITTNAGTASGSVETNFHCPVLLRAYPSSSRRGPPAYDLPALVDCPMMARLIVLEPGQADTSVHRTPFSSLRRELGSRRYYLTGLVWLASGIHELTAGEIELSR